MDHVSPPNALDNESLSAGTPVLDIERYRAGIEGDFDDRAAADAFLRALWHIMCSFVDLGQDVKSSTENLPFMRELSSEFRTAAPVSKDTKQPTKKTPPKKR